MQNLSDAKEKIHSCSKCGLCQSVCPIYKLTGNDCTVSRGHFIMLSGLIKGKLKMSKTMNRYLDLCLKCGACTKFCPSGIDVVDIVAMAKQEYFKNNWKEKILSLLQKFFIFGLGFNLIHLFKRNTKSKKFDKKVIYFGGCSNKLNGNASIVKILNSCGIEVITPNFNCCGIPFFVRGDMKSFQSYIDSFYKIIKKQGINEIITTCASCEKTLKSYPKWNGENNFIVKNIFEYIRENNLQLELKKHKQVTFHKPCNINNFNDIEWILNNTKNLEYTEMPEYDKCCGLNGIFKIKEYKTMLKLFNQKRNNIKSTKAKIVLTSCFGCENALKFYSFGKYKVQDFTNFIAKNIKN